MSILELLAENNIATVDVYDTSLYFEGSFGAHAILTREQVLALSLELFNIGIHMEPEK